MKPNKQPALPGLAVAPPKDEPLSLVAAAGRGEPALWVSKLAVYKDWPPSKDTLLRQVIDTRLARLGASSHTESAITAWTGTTATVRSLLDGGEQIVEADALVLATTNISETAVIDELAGRLPEMHLAGDAVAARLAVQAIYEGRVIGMSL